MEFVDGGRFGASPDGVAVGVACRRCSAILPSSGGWPSTMGVGQGVGGVGDIVARPVRLGRAAAIGLPDVTPTCRELEDGKFTISWEDSLMVGRAAVRRLRLAPGG